MDRKLIVFMFLIDLFVVISFVAAEDSIEPDNPIMGALKVVQSEGSNPPVADAGGPYSGSEGWPITLNASGSSDNGTIDLYEWDWNNDGVYDENATSPLISKTWNDNYAGIVGLKVTDNDGLTDTDTASVTVQNMAPLVAAVPDLFKNEGDLAGPVHAHFLDFGSDDGPFTATINWGDGTPTEPCSCTYTPGGNGAPADGSVDSGTHFYADNGIYSVNIMVTDKDGGVGAVDVLATVENVAPLVDDAPDVWTNEGLPAPALAHFNDKGTLDTHTATINWGDGSTEDASVDEMPFGPPGSAEGMSGMVLGVHVYADNGMYTVTVTVTDDDAGSGSKTLMVAVSNVAPTVNAGSDQTANEGATVSFSGSFTDPSTADTHTIFWNFGDGTNTTGTLTPTHAYADNGLYTVTLKITDDDGGVGIDTLLVTVYNVAPTPEAGPDQTVNVGEVVSFFGSFTDPGWLDTHTIFWDFGDGTNTTGTLNPTHTYEDNGTYTVTLRVTDDDDGVGIDTLKVIAKTAAPTPPVGGIYIPVNKLSLLAPYIGLTILFIAAVIAVGYVKKRKRHTEISS